MTTDFLKKPKKKKNLFFLKNTHYMGDGWVEWGGVTVCFFHLSLSLCLTERHPLTFGALHRSKRAAGKWNKGNTFFSSNAEQIEREGGKKLGLKYKSPLLNSVLVQ